MGASETGAPYGGDTVHDHRSCFRYREPSPTDTGVLCPLDLTVERVARFLNCELADDTIYDGLELQYFDDAVHGTGMLAFLSRRADRRVDHYHEPGVTLDREGFELGGGTGAWTETSFEAARLQVADDGVDAEVRFGDVVGRAVEVRIDDRDGRPHRRGALLAPVGAGIERPNALLLVWLHGFDLVRATGTPPVIRIDGRRALTGRLPGARLHRRHLVKYGAPLCAVQVNRRHAGPLARVDPAAPGPVEMAADGQGIAAMTDEQGGHGARLALTPGLPDVRALADGALEQGNWEVEADGSG